MVSGKAQMFAQRLIPFTHAPLFSSTIIKSEKVRERGERESRRENVVRTE